jgi:hypothetical protein
MPCGVQRSAAAPACTISMELVCITVSAYDKFSVCEAEATRDHRLSGYVILGIQLVVCM